MTMDEWNERNKNAAGAFAPQEKPVAPETVTNGTQNIANQRNSQPITADQDASEMTGNLSLILGILSMIFGMFFGGAPWIGIFMGVAAIVMGVVEKKKNNPITKKIATAGFICGIVGVCISVCVGLFCLAVGIAIRTIGEILSIFF